jgi:hypothetical protein
LIILPHLGWQLMIDATPTYEVWVGVLAKCLKIQQLPKVPSTTATEFGHVYLQCGFFS